MLASGPVHRSVPRCRRERNRVRQAAPHGRAAPQLRSHSRAHQLSGRTNTGESTPCVLVDTEPVGTQELRLSRNQHKINYLHVVTRMLMSKIIYFLTDKKARPALSKRQRGKKNEQRKAGDRFADSAQPLPSSKAAPWIGRGKGNHRATSGGPFQAALWRERRPALCSVSNNFLDFDDNLLGAKVGRWAGLQRRCLMTG